jgi:UDP-glucose 4-epimerase
MNRASRGLLHVYLSDHLAAAVGGVALSRRAASGEQRTEFGPPLEALAAEIEQDLRHLRKIGKALGMSTRSPIKEGAAWLAERIGRLKLNRRILGRSPLSRVLEVELLQAAVAGKRGLWQTLLALDESALERTELEQLLRRADWQEERLRELHDQAARVAFGADAPHPAAHPTPQPA